MTETDVERGSRVAVIGAEVVDALFPAVDRLGRADLDGYTYRVIGVMERRGSFLASAWTTTS